MSLQRHWHKHLYHLFQVEVIAPYSQKIADSCIWCLILFYLKFCSLPWDQYLIVLAVILHVAHTPLKDLPPEESSHFLTFFSTQLLPSVYQYKGCGRELTPVLENYFSTFLIQRDRQPCPEQNPVIIWYQKHLQRWEKISVSVVFADL